MSEIIAYLKALTPEARAALEGECLKLDSFPFRVGRESRLELFGGALNRRRPDSLPNNDLYLVENGTMLNVSREHFLIDRNGAGHVLVDRGSACGTIVEGQLVGGEKRGGVRPLRDQDVIVVGTSDSKYIFKFIVRPTIQ